MTGIHDEVETYQPQINMGYENDIPQVDGQDSFKDITDEHGNINIIINSDVIGQTLAKKIYTSWLSGLRELYNNEARACRMSKKMGGKPSIVITINPNDSAKELIIQGVDSLGITKAMFNKVLRVIGTSGNRDGEEIGQFGMGFISYALLTDALILETWSRENNEHYAMLCDSGLKFKPVPLDTTNDVENMSNYGTKLTMTCNDEVDFSEAVELIRELARFSQIPTKIILLDNVEARTYRQQNYDKGIIDCEMYENGMDYIMKTSSAIKRMANSKHTDDTKVVFWDKITLDKEDYRFDGVIGITKSKYGSISLMERMSRVPMLLAGTKIDSAVSAEGFCASIINVKNERKYSPVASRDALESSAITEIEEQLHADLKEYMSKYDMNSIEDYNASLYKPIVSRNVMWSLEKYLSDSTKDISRTLNSRYAVEDGQMTLSDMLAQGGTIICLKSLRTDLMKALREHFDTNVIFFRMTSRLSDESRSHRIDLFKQLGIIMGEDYKKENAIKEKRSFIKGDNKSSFNEDRSIILYNSKSGTEDYKMFGSKSGWRSGSEKFSTTIGRVNEEVHPRMVIAKTKQFSNVLSILNQFSNDWKVMHDMKGLSEEILTFDNLMLSINDRYYQTNDGFVKGKELRGRYHVIIANNYTELLESVNVTRGNHEDEFRRFIALDSIDEYIELLWYHNTNSHGKFSFVFDQLGRKLGDSIFKDLDDRKFETLEFNQHDYDNQRATYVLRCYWINELLPENYADIFIEAVKNDVEKLDNIEKQARALNEVLKQ